MIARCPVCGAEIYLLAPSDPNKSSMQHAIDELVLRDKNKEIAELRGELVQCRETQERITRR